MYSMCAQKSLDEDQQFALAAVLAKAGLTGVMDSFVREKVTSLSTEEYSYKRTRVYQHYR